MVTIDDIRASAVRAKGNIRKTPLLSSPFLDEIAGRPVYIKAEQLQHTGSFKYRGAWSAISAMTAKQRKNGVVAFSSGNHAQAIARVATLHDIPATIIMPIDAPKLKISNTKALGANVVLYNRDTEDRDEIGAQLSSEKGFHLIKPFDDPYVIAGQGTLGLELGEQLKAMDILPSEVLVCCGGGGLTAGVAIAMHDYSLDIKVHPVEPENFDDVAISLATGTRQKNKTSSGSICDAIVTPTPGQLTFPIMQKYCGTGYVVNDGEALQAIAQAFLRLKIVIEPGGAVALAAALYHAKPSTNPIVAIATGGNIDPEIFKLAIQKL